MKKLFFLLLCLSVAPLCIQPQDGESSEQTASYLETFLPEPGQLPGYIVLDTPRRYTRQILSEYLGDDAARFYPYGVLEILAVRYGREADGPALELTVYGFLEGRGAFGVFAMERPDEASIHLSENRRYRTADSIHFHQGRYYVTIKIEAPDESLIRDAETCASAVAENIPPEPGKPFEFLDFPPEHAILPSDRYIPVEYLGTDFLFEVLTRTYVRGKETWQAFLTVTPRKEEGQAVFSTFRAFLKQKDGFLEDRVEGTDEACRGELASHGRILIFRKGRHIAGVLGRSPAPFPRSFVSLLPVEETTDLSIYFQGDKVGEELFHLSRNGQGKIIRSVSISVLRLEGNILAFEQHLQNQPDGRPLSEYRLTAVENNRRTVFSARPEENLLNISSSDGFNRRLHQLPLPEDMVILDNLLASHYQLLVDRYDFQKKGRHRYTAFVPQSFAQVPLEIHWEGVDEATRDGEKIKAHRLVVTSPNLLIYLWADPQRRLLQIDVPAQAYRFSRNDITVERSERPLPAYLNADLVQEENISFPSGKIYINGAVTYPAGNTEARPAVVLVGGSGPLDRDESIGPNKPFRDLAYGLASKGILALRYDKRSFTIPESIDPFTATLRQDIMEDAIAALRYLKGRGDVDNERIFLIGHSLGATAACHLIQEEPVSGGLILLTPHARTLDRLVLEQTAFMMKNAGMADNEIAAEKDKTESGFKKIREEEFPEKTLFLGIGPQYWQDILKKTVLEEIEKLTVPFLIIHGGKDYQVTRIEHDLLKKRVEEKAIGGARLLFYPELNHYLMPIEGDPSPRDYGVAGHVGIEAVEDISDFILSGGA